MSTRRCQDQVAGAESGAGAGVLSGHIRCVLMIRFLAILAHSCGVSATVRNIWLHDGFRGFYRGLGPTILGYLPTWAIYFAVYDGIKTAFGEVPLGVQAPPHERLYPAAQPKGYQPVMREHSWSLHILSAMSAGATSTICTNPLWVIKTRFMVRRIIYYFPRVLNMLRCLLRLSLVTKSGIDTQLMLLLRFIGQKDYEHSTAVFFPAFLG